MLADQFTRAISQIQLPQPQVTVLLAAPASSATTGCWSDAFKYKHMQDVKLLDSMLTL